MKQVLTDVTNHSCGDLWWAKGFESFYFQLLIGQPAGFLPAMRILCLAPELEDGYYSLVAGGQISSGIEEKSRLTLITKYKKMRGRGEGGMDLQSLSEKPQDQPNRHKKDTN